MGISEFDLIRDYFAGLTLARADVGLGIGDDCALLGVPHDRQLAVSMDTLVAGRHFAPGADPEALGHKCLAVNLSDLAAMGAEPAWVTLSLTLPEADPDWLAAFARGFAALAAQHGVQLVGGDTTRGPLSITVQVHGFVEPGQALRRDGAAAGDLLYVTGTLGDAGLALRGSDDPAMQARLHRPTPRIEAGIALRGLASAAIDVSDGLAADLGHICERSGVAARVELAKLPLSAPVAAAVDQGGDWSLPLASGDDYELCIAVPPVYQQQVEVLAADWPCGLTRIGELTAGHGLTLVYPDGRDSSDIPAGFDHFAHD